MSCLIVSGSEVIELFFMLNSAEHEIYPAHNVKMPTNVGILTFISRIFVSRMNTPSESLKARKISVFKHFSFYDQLKFYAQLS